MPNCVLVIVKVVCADTCIRMHMHPHVLVNCLVSMFLLLDFQVLRSVKIIKPFIRQK